MLDFQPTIVTFPTESISATQAIKVREGKEEMEIDSCGASTNIGIRTQEEPSRQPQPKLQFDFDTKVKVTKVLEVSVEKVEESPPRSQLEGALSKIIKLIIKFPSDPVG
jgi:hypothetical protein